MGSLDTTTAKGSCICGKSTFEVSGEPAMTAICHCLSCRKLTGSAYSTVFLVPSSSFSFSPSSTSIKTVTVHHEVGIPMHISFCGDCGTALCKTADADDFKGLTIVLAGVMDDGGERLKAVPQAELWTKYRVGWTGKVGQGVMKECEGFT